MPAIADIEPDDAEHANLILDVQGILETLHSSGLAFVLACDGRGSIAVKLGAPIGSEPSSTDAADAPLTVAEAAVWLRDNACAQYPNSDFSRRYRNQVERRGCIHTPGTRWARSCGCICPAEQPQPANGAYFINPKCPAHGFA